MSRPAVPQLRRALTASAGLVMNIAQRLDTTGSNVLTTRQFRRLLRQLQVRNVEADEANTLFESWDDDDDGVISLIELNRILHNGGRRRKVPSKCPHGEFITQADLTSPTFDVQELADMGLANTVGLSGFGGSRDRSNRLPFVSRRLSAASVYSKAQKAMMEALKGGLDDFSLDFQTWSDASEISRSDFKVVLQQLGVQEGDRFMEALFASMDTGNSGFVQLGALKAALKRATNSAMQSVGAHGDKAQAKAAQAASSTASSLAAVYSAADSGSKREAVQSMLRDSLVLQANRVMNLFQGWDANGDGIISRDEFRTGVSELGVVAPPAEIEELFGMFDIDNSGQISFRELHTMLRRTKASDDERARRFTKGKSTKKRPVADFEDLRKEVAASVRIASIQTQFNFKENKEKAAKEDEGADKE
mmetsp:Transcript_39771/g.109517  ORF Transcript_39771/g.109517 Transcript_39771/m.109517 type:complete len:420 (+) Transcript_39771:2-1261(+)